MKSCQVEWTQDDNGDYVWSCRKFFLTTTKHFKPEIESCYRYGCPGRKPYIRNGVVITDFEQLKEADKNPPAVEEVKEPEIAICGWFKCDKPVAPNKLKHCSEVCRKRQNRWDYKQRKKLEQS